MNLSKIAIRRHIGTLMLTLAVIVVGIFFIFRLQVDLLPAITYPRIGLRVNIPGVSPEVAVEEITKPLEEALTATEGVVQVVSNTREGRVRIDLYFKPGGNIDRALSDATATFNRNRNRLPDLVTEARLFKFDPSQLPIYEFALESDSLDDLGLKIFADEELSRELTVIPGVATVDVSGGVDEEVRIEIDSKRLQALGIGVNQVLDALDVRNRDIAGGRLRGETGEPLIRTIGKFTSVEEIRNLSLDLGEGNLGRNNVYLRDVATITDGEAEQRVFVSLNRKPAVKITIQKQPDANTITVIEEVKKKLVWLQESGVISEDMELVTTRDESGFIINSISNVAIAGITGTILAAIAVFIFLGSLRQTFIIVLAIPLATLAAIILMKLFGLSINIFSLGGLALGVGIVVDNSIVMLENIALRVGEWETRESGRLGDWGDKGTRETGGQGRNIIKIAEKASSEVESALVASTATNLVAVLPFLLVGGLFSLLFRELILTISFAIAASLLLAVTVVPMLASRLLTIPYSANLNHFPLLVWFNQGFTGITNSYGYFLKGILRYRLLTIVLVFLILGGSSISLAQNIPQEILPRINTGEAQMFASFPPGTNLETNKKVMKAVDEILLRQPETEYVFTSTGGFLFGNSTIENLLRSSSTITLKPDTNLDSFIARVNQEFRKLHLVDIRLRIFPQRVRGLNLNNSPVRGDIDLILQGKDTKLLQQTGRKILEILDEKATLARFRADTDPRQPEIQIKPNPERLAEYGLTLQDIGNTVQTAIAGSVATQLQRDDRLVDIRVKLTDSRQSLAQLQGLPLFTGDDSPIKLRDVANLTIGEAPGEIQRINQRSVYIMVGNLSEGANLSNALAETQSIINELELPPGVSLLPSYAAASNQQIQSALKVLGGLAVFLVFVVMAVQYNSLVDPLVILLTVPLALAGGIIGLYVTQTAIGATVLIGAVLLVGIVVNNAIVMVELANQIYTSGKYNRSIAIIQAATSRLRPILMTTITTVLGMFPLALGIGEGSEFLQPLGVVVFSGLALATGLTLVIIPCFYVLLHDLFGNFS
ncbi:MAG: efflux RND transporter permease subunit, partial [Xenococcaceae cyanobacterium MO_188.B19]|nr:efflux RND transporter permease subunit [Xenococcaceae cyanobacterium MO_188.B19]